MTLNETSRRQLIVERVASASQKSIVIQVILVLSSFVGLCSSIFPVLKSINVSDKTAYVVTTITSAAVITVLLAFFFFASWKIYLVRATIVLLFLISAVLCALLYWQRFVDVDEWDVWKEKLSSRANACDKAYPDEPAKRDPALDYVKCVSEAVSEKYPHEGEEGDFKILSLGNDVRAGTYLMNMNDRSVYNLLVKKLGIGERFIGTGIGVPHGAKDYGDAKLPEYLIPNLRESDAKVLTWQIDKPFEPLSHSVECFIVGCTDGDRQIAPTFPSNIKPGNREKYDEILKYVKSSSRRKILLRLNQFNRDLYKGCLGRSEASQVFAIRLEDVWHLTLEEAIKYSGHKLEDNGPTIFVWLWVPTDEDLVTAATWKNILPGMRKLLPGKCPSE